MKPFRVILILCCLVVCLCACSDGGSKSAFRTTDAQLYRAGMDLIATMEEMIQSEEYAALFSTSVFSDVLEEVDTGDYDSPIAVYSITLPDTETMLELAGADTNELWNGLSDDLKEQVKNRLSFSTIVAINNNYYGSKWVAFGATYTASRTVNTIKPKETTVFLYVFEEGTPIAVTFSPSGSLFGQFFFLDDIDTLPDATKVFEEYECAVHRVDID